MQPVITLAALPPGEYEVDGKCYEEAAEPAEYRRCLGECLVKRKKKKHDPSDDARVDCHSERHRKFHIPLFVEQGFPA
jgi:hypothetical protein